MSDDSRLVIYASERGRRMPLALLELSCLWEREDGTPLLTAHDQRILNAYAKILQGEAVDPLPVETDAGTAYLLADDIHHEAEQLFSDVLEAGIARLRQGGVEMHFRLQLTEEGDLLAVQQSSTEKEETEHYD